MNLKEGYILFKITAADYKIKDTCQIVVKHVDRNIIVEKTLLKEDKEYIIPQEYFEQGILNFNFKVQEKVNKRWVDKVKYFYVGNLADFLCDEINYSDDDLKIIINHYYNLEDYIFPHVRQLINKTVRHLENKSGLSNKNIRQYLKLLEEYEKDIPDLWRNINVLIKHLYKLKNNLIKNNILNLNYQKISSSKEDNVVNFREFLIKECELLKNYNLPFADFLAGRHYSVLQNRNEAAILFQNFLSYEVPFEKLLISIGISTYFDIKDEIEDIPKVNSPIFIDKQPVNYTNTAIIVSVDINYLRKYGPQLFVSIIALKKYQVHIHVIGDYSDSTDAINEAKELFNKILLFYKTEKEVRIPTFSTESIPDFVKDDITYYACSRFVHANSFKNWFNTDILIIDVDFLITDDLKNMMKKISNYDVALTLTEGITSMTPWTRAMGGTLYLNHNSRSEKFIEYTRNYILYGLSFENSWILDQNALCYAQEKLSSKDDEIKIFSIPYKIRPLKQFRIRYFMEERF